jgi:hypothetical protein
MGLIDLDFESSKAPEVLLWGFVELHALYNIDAQVCCSSGSDDVATVSIYDPIRSIDIRMYRLPAADGQFTEDLKLYGRFPKSWPMPNGRAFDESVLYPQGVPPTWKHKAVQLSSPGIVHAARGGGRGLIVRHVFHPQLLLDDAMFRWFEKKVVVIEKAWKLDPPKIHVPRHDDEVDLISEEALSAEELDQVVENAGRAWDVLKLKDNATRTDVINAIYDAIEAFRPQFAGFKPNVQHNMAVSFGSLWGQMLCGAVGWDWIGLSRDGDESFLALASPDRAHAIAPLNLMTSNLMPDVNDDSTPPQNTVRLTFNMIEAGKLPPSRPKAYLMLSSPS